MLPPSACGAAGAALVGRGLGDTAGSWGAPQNSNSCRHRGAGWLRSQSLVRDLLWVQIVQRGGGG